MHASSAGFSRNGYAPEFCTDLDIHADPDLCNRYRLLLSVGHDEYWTETTRDATEDFVSRGGNVAFFGANLCWWRIHIVDEGTAILCHQGGPHGAFDHWWPGTGAGRPEDALTGVSYRNGGGWWDGPAGCGWIIVQEPGALGIRWNRVEPRRSVRRQYLAAAGRVRMRRRAAGKL